MRGIFQIAGRLLMGLFISALSAKANMESHSTPHGFRRVQIEGSTGGTLKIHPYSYTVRAEIPDHISGRIKGVIFSVGDFSITGDSPQWNAGQFSKPEEPYFVQMISGEAIGRVFAINSTAETQNSEETLFIDNTQSLTTLGVRPGDSFQIFKGITLKQLLPPDKVQKGSSSAAADSVAVCRNGVWETYFAHQSGEWRKGLLPVSYDNLVIHPDSGIQIHRRSPDPLLLIEKGSVSPTGRAIPIALNQTSLVTTGFPSSVKLGDLGIQSVSGWNSAMTAKTASQVAIYENGLLRSYFHYAGTPSNWRTGTLPISQNAKEIPGGAPFVITHPSSPAEGNSILWVLHPSIEN